MTKPLDREYLQRLLRGAAPEEVAGEDVYPSKWASLWDFVQAGVAVAEELANLYDAGEQDDELDGKLALIEARIDGLKRQLIAQGESVAKVEAFVAGAVQAAAELHGH